MTDKELGKRMKAILNLAHYSTQVTLHIDCLLHDGRNDVNVVGDYWDPTKRVVDIKVIHDD